MKVFRGEAQPGQAVAAAGLVGDDVAAGKLVKMAVDWPLAWRESNRLAETHAATVGCRSLDILHAALAEVLRASLFVSSDTRQLALARQAALRVLAI